MAKLNISEKSEIAKIRLIEYPLIEGNTEDISPFEEFCMRNRLKLVVYQRQV